MKSDKQNEISNVKRTLHDLIRALPAIKQHKGSDSVQLQLKLIAHFQRKHDQVISG